MQPPSDGTIVEESHLGDQKTAKKLAPDPSQRHNDPVVDVVEKTKTLVNGRKDKDDGKRSLRSHDGGSRSKSELAQYFPNFDEIINPEAREKGMFYILGDSMAVNLPLF